MNYKFDNPDNLIVILNGQLFKNEHTAFPINGYIVCFILVEGCKHFYKALGIR